MVKADFGGDFLNYENSKDGQMAIIVEKPAMGELEYDGKKKNVVNITVEVNTKKLVFTPGLKAGRSMVSAWGEEMDHCG